MNIYKYSLRKILRISWTERKTNVSVLEQLGFKAPQLLNLIKKQKLSYFGHFKRHNTLEKLFLEGTCEGRRGRRRPRKRWTQEIGEWMGVSTVEAGRQALERGEFRQAVWEATSIKGSAIEEEDKYSAVQTLCWVK